MSPRENIISILRSLKPELITRYGVKSLGLFGSVTRDDFRPDKSDVDIIVDFSKPVGVEFIDLAEFLERKIQWKIDLVSRRGIKTGYMKLIEPEIIYV